MKPVTVTHEVAPNGSVMVVITTDLPTEAEVLEALKTAEPGEMRPSRADRVIDRWADIEERRDWG